MNRPAVELATQPIHRAQPPAVVAPLAPSRYKIQFTADQALHDKLERAQELLSHQVAAGDLAAVFDRALELLVDKLERDKRGKAKRPRPSVPPAHGEEPGRAVPREIRRKVWTRDGGQCRFVDASGRRCSARRYLELHHVKPWALAKRHERAEAARSERGLRGQHAPGQIELRCRAHNQYEAELDYGSRATQQWRALGRPADPAVIPPPSERIRDSP